MHINKLMTVFLAIAIGLSGCTEKNETPPSTQKQIKAFSINSVSASISSDETNRVISLELPRGTDLTKLIPQIVVSDHASIRPASGVETNFTNPVKYTVIAEDGSKVEYTINVTTRKNEEKKILAFVLPDVDNLLATIDQENLIISKEVGYGVDITKLKPQISLPEGATISPESGIETDFTNPVKYTVTAEDGSKTEYTANIIKGKNSEKKILTFTFPSLNNLSATIDYEKNTIAAQVDYNVDITKLVPKIIVSDEATVSPASDAVANFTNPVKYTVTAHDGSKTEYTVTITVNKNTEKQILSFTFPQLPSIKPIIDEEKKTIEAEVEYDVDVSKLTPTIVLSDRATLNDNGLKIHRLF